MVMDVYQPTSPAVSIVERVALVQATSEQWATLRSPFVQS